MTNNLYEFHKTYQENLINLFKVQRISRTIAVIGPNGIGKKISLLILLNQDSKNLIRLIKIFIPIVLLLIQQMEKYWLKI